MTIEKHRVFSYVCILPGIALVVLVFRCLMSIGIYPLTEKSMAASFFGFIIFPLVPLSVGIPFELFQALIQAECPACKQRSCRVRSEGVFYRHKYNRYRQPKPGQRLCDYYKCDFCGWEEAGKRA
jgi:hypothetical protein